MAGAVDSSRRVARSPGPNAKGKVTLLSAGTAALFLARIVGPSATDGLLRTVTVFLVGMAAVLAVAQVGARRYTERLAPSGCGAELRHLVLAESVVAGVLATTTALLGLSGRMYAVGVALALVSGLSWVVVQAQIAVVLQHRDAIRLYDRFMTATNAGRWVGTTRSALRHPWLARPCHLWEALARVPGPGTVPAFVLLVAFLAGAGGGLGLGIRGIDAVAVAVRQAPLLAPGPILTPTVAPYGGPPGSGDTYGVPSRPRPLGPPWDGSSMPTFAEVCGPPPLVLPGQDAPEWAAQQLNALYFGPGTGVGAIVAGCPTRTRTITDAFDTVAYQLGFGPGGRLRSIATVGMEHGPAILLGEVAAYARPLLESGQSVAASPRIDVGAGDFQLLYTASGTTTFVRIEKVARGDDASYVVLLPSATVCWFAAMTETDEWLWPVPSAHEIELLSSAYSPSAGTIVAGDRHQASLVPGGKGIDCTPHLVTLDELVALLP